MTTVESTRTPSQSSSGATRASLISRVRCHESKAWCELVELYGPLIAHWCYRFELDSHTTADCVQEVFAAVSSGLPQYRSRNNHGSFRSWLWTITRNRVVDQLRRKQSQGLAKGGTSAMDKLRQIPAASEEETADEPSSDAELKRLVARALDQIRNEFETRSMNIFQRSVIDQVATAIVAAEFNVQPATVRQTRSRILRRLRQQLGDIES
jgi:RNA polymerase sigma-70 factor, ECF subfamily